MDSEPVLVALPGTLCTPAVFEPLAAALAGQVTVEPVSWLTEPGPWDIPAVAAAVRDLLARVTGASPRRVTDPATSPRRPA